MALVRRNSHGFFQMRGRNSCINEIIWSKKEGAGLKGWTQEGKEGLQCEFAYAEKLLELGQREIAHLCLSIPFLSILGRQPFLAQKLKAPRSNPTKVDGTDKAGPGIAGCDRGGFSVLLERRV